MPLCCKSCDAPAPSVVMANHAEMFAGRDVVWFVDNEGACSTLIRGACRPEEISGIAECSSILAARLGVRIWYEWIDTKANPSDGLSRLGVLCPLFGRFASEGAQPSWQFLPDHMSRLRWMLEQPLSCLCEARGDIGGAPHTW